MTVDSYFLKLTIDYGQLTIIWPTDVSVFGLRRVKEYTLSETVGNGLCAVPKRIEYNPCG